jgi:PAS domain S-box-containing protein
LVDTRFAAKGLATAIFDSEHVLALAMDVEGRINGFNRACEVLTGYEAEEMIGSHVWDKLLPEEDIEPIRQFFADLPDGGDFPEEYENTWIARDGRRSIITWNKSLLRDSAGNIELVVGIGIDVTEQRESENHHQRLTDSFANAQRIAKIGNWNWDAVTRNEWWSDEVYRIVGLEPGSVVASYDRFIERCHPEDREKISMAIRTAQDNLTSYAVIFRIVRPDGTERVVRETGECVLDGNGQLAGLAGTIQDITDQHDAEQALADTARQLEAAVRLTRLGSWEWNPATDRLSMSDQTLQICGLDAQHCEVDNDFVMAMIPDEEREEIRKMMAEAISSGEAYTHNYHIVRPSGDKRSVLEHGKASRDDATGEIRLLGTILDITEQQRTGEELARTLQRLGDSQRAARIGSWEWDAETDRDWWSEQQKMNYGIREPAGFVHGEYYLEFAHPDDRPLAEEAVVSALKNAGQMNFEFRTIGADGVERVLWIFGMTETDDEGRVVRAYGTTQDITDRRKMEKALQESEARLRGLFDHAPVGIGLSDTGGHLIQVNDSFASLLGYKPDEMLDLTYRDVTHPDHLAPSAWQMQQLQSGEASTVSIEKIFVRKDGTGVWGNRTQTLVRDKNGQPLFHVVIVEDIDDRKRAEAALARATTRLEEAHRIADLGHWEWLPDSENSVWSDQMFRIYGMEPGEIQSTHDSFFSMLHEEDRDAIAETMARTLETGEPYETEFRIIRIDGTVRHVFERAERYTDERTGRQSIRGVMQDITDRKAVEEELRETADKLEKSQRIAKIGSWVWEIAEDKEWWSDQIYRMFGLEPGSVVMDGYGFLDYVHPEDRKRVRRAQDRSLSEGVPYAVEYRLQRADGREIIVSEHGEMEFDADGNPLRMRGTAQDITERKKAEQVLRETTERLEEAQRLGLMGSWTWYPEEDVEWWSDQQYRIFGLESGTAIPNAWAFLNHVHPEDREYAEEIQRHAVEALEPFSLEYRIIRPDGTERVVIEQGEWVADDRAGNPHWRGIVQDITERKAIEDKLRETSEDLKETQRIGKLGSWAWDIREDKEWWSEEIYRMLGMEIVNDPRGGHDFLDYVHPADRERISAALAQSIEEDVPYAAEYRVTGADGRKLVFSEHAETEFDRNGKAVRMRGTTQDITQIKRIEQQLAELNVELEQRVQERTAELRTAQTELLKSERLATLGQLTATVSHELRNPLGSMRSSIYVVAHKVESQDKQLQAAIERINRNITRCDQIIDELLDYTRIRDLELNPTNIDNWLAGIIDEQHVPHGVKVERFLKAPGVLVPVDTDRLRRAFINLFENACQAATEMPGRDAPARDATVSVTTSVRQDIFEIAVSDNGYGILPENRDKIFEPLFSTKNFGVGLGLPTVKQIMEQHGGGIEINDNPGGGAIFALWLPLGGK